MIKTAIVLAAIVGALQVGAGALAKNNATDTVAKAVATRMAAVDVATN